MQRLFEDIGGKSTVAVLVIYALISWAILRSISSLGDAFGLPAWVFTGALVLLSIGLPIIFVTALVQRRTPSDEGETPPPAMAPDVAAIRRMLSWRNAMVGGVGGFAALAIGTAAWLVGGPGVRPEVRVTGASTLASPITSRSSSEDAAAAVMVELADAIRSMDVDRTLAVYDEAPDFVYSFGSQVISGREAFDATVRGGFAALQSIESWEIEDIETIPLDDDHVMVVASYREEAVDAAGNRVHYTGVHSNLMVRRADGWKVWSGHASADPVEQD